MDFEKEIELLVSENPEKSSAIREAYFLGAMMAADFYRQRVMYSFENGAVYQSGFLIDLGVRVTDWMSQAKWLPSLRLRALIEQDLQSMTENK